MKRFVIMTVGKTHSGKSTFARELEKELPNSVVIDQDNHAEFLHTYYPKLLPKQGPNMIKYTLTQTIVDNAISKTDCHLILCNSNRNRKGRLYLLKQYHDKGFSSILVNFDIPDHVLKERVLGSKRSEIILRVASSFEEVLTRQQDEDIHGDVISPTEGEANHFFSIKNENDFLDVIRKIVNLVQN